MHPEEAASHDGIKPGDRLGRFEILAPLGGGGMGRVYRARDLQLMREVAIKVLPAAFRSDPERERRLEREARAAAALNHPNVLAVHDFGVHDQTAFIVTELLEGETLRDQIRGRPLPPRVAVEYAVQIAGGLAAGHEHGIVHLDVKPENLFVTTDRRLKILDFGLARISDPTSSEPTLTSEGLLSAPVAGTPAYMSPEQVRGLRADHRSDIFSAGVVLHEMLAGVSPFRRRSAGESLAATLDDDPPPLRGVSPELERVVLHCLEKAPEERFQNARDLIFALQSLPDSALAARARIRSGARPGHFAAWLSLALLVVAAAVAALVLWRRVTVRDVAPAVPRVARLTDFAGLEEYPSISPDRRSVAFTANVKGRRQIFVRLIAGGLPVQITSDESDHELPRWSPDGNSLFYFSPAAPREIEGDIWRVPSLGGSPQRITAAISGADVSAAGRLAYFRVVERNVQLVTSALDGSDIQLVAGSVPGYHLYPRWSPDGKFIAFQRGDGVRYDLFVIPRRGGEARPLTRDMNVIRGLAWTPDSAALVYASSHGSTLPYLPPLSLWEVRLADGSKRQLTGNDVWYEQPDIDREGTVSAARMRMRFDIWRFPFPGDVHARIGDPQRLTQQTAQVLTPSASPDGEHIVFLSDSGEHSNLWVMSARTGEQRQITFERDPDVSVGVPIWSPDGSWIAFVSSKGRSGLDFGIWLTDPEGRSVRNIVRHGLGFAWSSDGRWLYYVERAPSKLSRIAVSGGAPVEVRREPVRNVIGVHQSTLYYMVEYALFDGRPELEIRAATPENGRSRAVARIPASRVPGWQIVNPALSPDGQWLAMPLTDGFTTNIWVLSTRTGAWRRVSDFGDRATFIARRVSWSPDGRSILAAVGEGDADIVLLPGVIPAPRRR